MYVVMILLLAFYSFTVLLLTGYCLLQLHLLYYYKKAPDKDFSNAQSDDHCEPHVTIQLPIFNEQYVVKRLLNQIIKMEYPREKLQIQILDDSTDETLDLSRKIAKQYSNLGFDISVIHRKNRSGYKAGALNHGLKTAKGEFIAIFDADFLPQENFLKKTLPYFKKRDIGVVQTRWTHLNQRYSLLTRLQAYQLNVHFTVEQSGRHRGNLMLQFNGTAGIWRRETIDRAGGWEADTITEDLDLSYRAQLAGYKICYLEHIPSPAELPVEMSSLKSQQFRWMKGGAEVARKILPQIICNQQLTLGQRLHAIGHVLNSSVFLLILTTGILSIPLMFLLRHFEIKIPYLSIGFMGMISIVLVYYEANVRSKLEAKNRWKSIYTFLFMFPVFLSLSMGLSLHNALAVLQGFSGKKTAFIRTPKFNMISGKEVWKGNQYLKRKWSVLDLVEGMLGLVFLVLSFNGIWHKDLGFLYLHLLFGIGFSTVFYYSIIHGSKNV